MIEAKYVSMTTFTGRRSLNSTVKKIDDHRIMELYRLGINGMVTCACICTHTHAPVTVYKAVIKSRAEMAT